jgi:hypothetical protein
VSEQDSQIETTQCPGNHAAGGSLDDDVASACAEGALSDAALVQRCLGGDENAWEQLYYRCHPGLLRAIRFLLEPESRDVNLVDEIAARVWYQLLRDDARLLSKFDPERDCRLLGYLVGFARNEIMQNARAERRRRSHEAVGGQLLLRSQRASNWPIGPLLDEFAATLNQRERQFLKEFLLLPPDDEKEPVEEAISPTNVWQRRHRIRFKLKAFMQDR